MPPICPARPPSALASINPIGPRAASPLALNIDAVADLLAAEAELMPVPPAACEMLAEVSAPLAENDPPKVPTPAAAPAMQPQRSQKLLRCLEILRRPQPM